MHSVPFLIELSVIMASFYVVFVVFILFSKILLLQYAWERSILFSADLIIFYWNLIFSAINLWPVDRFFSSAKRVSNASVFYLPLQKVHLLIFLHCNIFTSPFKGKKCAARLFSVSFTNSVYQGYKQHFFFPRCFSSGNALCKKCNLKSLWSCYRQWILYKL